MRRETYLQRIERVVPGCAPGLSRAMTRRAWMQAAAAGAFAASASGWLPDLARAADDATGAAANNGKRRQCLLLWMVGGPTQTDTFDMKPGHANGGEFKEMETNAPGLRFSEHLPKLAQHADKLAVIRSLSTKEGDHGRGTYLMRTGRQPMGPVRYPTIGAAVAKELKAKATSPTPGDDIEAIPGFVSISPYRAFNQAAFGPGFLGPKFAPLTVGATDALQAAAAPDADSYAELKVDDLLPPAGVSAKQIENRLRIWRSLQDNFLATHNAAAPKAHDTVYRRAVKLMNSQAAQAFDLTGEPDAVREAYGRGRFGQGCLMARRLLEAGVGFVEVSLGTIAGNAIGWDTHVNNFAAVKQLSAELDAGWATLMSELAERGLLENTTILWMGEFGRTPNINPSGGRDHFPAAWTCVLGGGGIRGGQAYGKTSADGMTVEENKVDVPDVLATLCRAIGIDPATENISEQGRPIKIAEGTPIEAVLA
jgi:hypothetical protein